MIGHLSAEQIREVLTENTVGRIGCTDGEKVYVIPVNYLYQEKEILCHSQVGNKILMMRRFPKVCFEVDEIKEVDSWKSVLAWGSYEEITNEQKKFDSLQAFLKRRMFLKIDDTAPSPEQAATRQRPQSLPIRAVMFHILIEEMLGRFQTPENEKEPHA